MPDPITALIGGGATLLGSSMQAGAAEEAAGAQSAAAMAGVAEQRRQFDEIRKLLQPYTEAGAPALAAQQAMLGLGATGAEQAQIEAVRRSPTFQALLKSGEESILSKASATGGLRGGNVQAALAQFAPALLAQELENRYTKLGGLTSLGQQSAAGVGTAGSAAAGNIATLLGESGAAQAAGALGQAQAYGGALSGLSSGLGQYYGLTGKSLFSGLGSTTAAPVFDLTSSGMTQVL